MFDRTKNRIEKDHPHSPLPDVGDVSALGAPQRGRREAHEDGRRHQGAVRGVELCRDVRRVTQHRGDHGPLGREPDG